ncbi:hypothetical protein BX600DRAFT_445656 [Xylariales sp. PMI_506]|nr:hypothetical protein BX600DRAFT_445656 [Xylariales sp. PMI_506]
MIWSATLFYRFNCKSRLQNLSSAVCILSLYSVTCNGLRHSLVSTPDLLPAVEATIITQSSLCHSSQLCAGEAPTSYPLKLRLTRDPPHVMDSLPNEILIHAFSLFPTTSLLSLAHVCQRFYSLVSRVHYARLIEAIALEDHELILECYHPSAKISTPYMFCNYIGTDGLEEIGRNPTMKELGELYSRFRPVLGEENRRPRARYPTRSVIEGFDQPLVDLAAHEVSLDASELFSQLCTVINLVKIGPRRGLFLSCVNIIEGVARIWREWLTSQAELSANPRSTKKAASLGPFDSSILWADRTMNVGLRVRVTVNPSFHAPVLVGPHDEPPVSYILEYEELLVRTNQLLLSMERSEAQQVNPSAKAIVIASV